MVKKITSFLFTVAVCMSYLTLTSCHGLPKPVSYYQNQDKEEAESLVQENRQAFIDKIAEAYGDSAALTDIECVRVFPEKYDAGYKSYTKMLKGTLTIDGKSYEALYNCWNGEVRDSVHTEAIMSELTDSLPLDQSKIVEIVYPESTGDWDYGEQWKFPCGVKTLDDAVSWQVSSDATIYIWIYTLEDVCHFTEADFSSIPEIQKLLKSKSLCTITIMSLNDADAIDKLKEQMMKRIDPVKQLFYSTTTDELIAKIFSEYQLTNAIKIGNTNSTADDKPTELEIVKVK